MPEGLAEVLLGLGVIALMAGAAQFALTPLMGDRMQHNVRAMGLKKQAGRWTVEKAERFSRIGAMVFLALGVVLLVGSGVVWLLSVVWCGGTDLVAA